MSVLVIALDETLIVDDTLKPHSTIAETVHKITSYISPEDHVIITLPSYSEDEKNAGPLLSSVGDSLTEAFQDEFHNKSCKCTVIHEPNSLVINKQNLELSHFDVNHRLKYEAVQEQNAHQQYDFLSRVHHACCIITYEKDITLYNGVSMAEMYASLLAQVIHADVLILLSDHQTLLLKKPKGQAYPVYHLRSKTIRKQIVEGCFESKGILPKLKAAVSFVESCKQSSAILTSLDGLESVKDGSGTLITYG